MKLISFISIILSFALSAAYNDELDEHDSLFDSEFNQNTNSLHPQQLTLNDWDSSLYGKPICTTIPSNMSLCTNIHYNQMKVPNLLGHESVDEIEYQSSVWLPLISINCHPDTQLFLCSLFAPICLEQPIYPCRSLCENVRNGCEARMNAYNYPWPAMFNCSKFPEDNGLCIQPESSAAPKVSSSEKPSVAIPVTITTTTSTSTSTVSKKTAAAASTNKNKPNKKKQQTTSLSTKLNQQCSGCNEVDTKEKIVEIFCKSDIVLRGRVQTFQPANLQPAKASRKFETISSQYITIAKRNRKIIKGQRLISNTNSYLTGNGQQTNKDRRKLDIFLLSANHLSTIIGNSKKTKHKIVYQKFSNKTQNTPATTRFCNCTNLKRNLHKKNAKYLIMANVIKTENIIHTKRNIKEINKRNNKQQQLIYLTYVLPWYRARQIAKFLDENNFDRNIMCKNYTTVINKRNSKIKIN